MVRLHILVSAMTALLFTLAVRPADAHDLPIERSLVVQVHASHAELLLIYSEPPGPRTERLLALYDSNRNGKIDGAEAVLARRPMLHRAFLGLDLEFAGVTTGEDEPKIRYKRERSGGIAVAVYQRIDFVTGADEMNLVITLEDTRGVPELDLVVEGADTWRLPDGSDEANFALKSGAKKTVTLTRTPTPVNESEPDRDWQPPASTRP